MKKTVFAFCVCFLCAFSSALSAQVNYFFTPENPQLGEPVTIGVTADYVKSAVLVQDDKRLGKAEFFPVSDFFAAILTIPSTVSSGGAVIRLENEDGYIIEIPLNIEPRSFESEEIALTPTLTAIRTEPDPQKTEESIHLWEILNARGTEVYHTGSFVPPVTSTRRTGNFGDRRVFKYSNGSSDTSIHAGVDYGIPTGTRVAACGAGRVALARSRINSGNSIVIEHAPGIYSLYYHLDKIEVKEGDIVNANALIGLSGSTGLSTGPHLHWEIRVNTENTDPDAFTARPLIDKNLIMSKLKL